LSRSLARQTKADAFVLDDFEALHSPRSSSSLIANYINGPKCLGALVSREIDYLEIFNSLDNFVGVVGGSELPSQLSLLNVLLEKCNRVLLGGHVAFSFLQAEGSHANDMDKVVLESIMKLKKKAKELECEIVLPTDLVCSDNDIVKTVASKDYKSTMQFKDIGQDTLDVYESLLKTAHGVYWSGNMGRSSEASSYHSTTEIAEIMKDLTKTNIQTIVAGADCRKIFTDLSNIHGEVTHITMGDFSSANILAGRQMKCLDCIDDKVYFD
jgi:phosphoglycerate kinase